MCKLLVSVRSVAEAVLANSSGVDFIDLKEPEQGALGALSVADTKAIIAQLNDDAVVSATIGDLPMQASLIDEAIQSRLGLGVEYLKVGFFEAELAQYQDCLRVLAQYAEKGIKLIVVLFAEYYYPHDLISQLAKVGVVGVMLDTAVKDGRTLLDHYDSRALTGFSDAVSSEGLMLGLAGALKQTHIAQLKPYQPDYLGFRTAVCDSQDRCGQLSVERIGQISKLL